MERLKRAFMNIRIRDKIIYAFLSVALIPFFLISILGIYITVNQAENNVTQYTGQMVKQVQETVDVYIAGIEKTMNQQIISLDEAALKTPKGRSDLWQPYEAQLTRTFMQIAKTHDEVAGVFLATGSDHYASVGMSRVSRDPFIEESWYRTAFYNPDQMQILSNTVGRNIETDATYSVDDVFSVVKAVKSAEGDVIAVLLFDIKHDIISASMEDSGIGEDGFFYVIDSQGSMVYTPVNDVVYRIKPQWILRKPEEPVTFETDGQRYQITHKTSERTKWTVVGVSSQREVHRGLSDLLWVFALILAGSLFFILFVSFKLSGTITKPIAKLGELLQAAEDGDLTTRHRWRYKDDVSELGRKYNGMLDQMQRLLAAVYEEQESVRRAEDKVLQEQFKPHFLYNTLDTIGWMAREHQADNIVGLVDALTSVFRISLSRGKDYITLAEETQYIANYLYIQKTRYGPKLSYSIEEDPDSMDLVVPKLILQPLVENAIYHGIKLIRRDGRIDITIRPEGEYVALVVADTGKGMTAEKVAELTALLNGSQAADEEHSFGLYYVVERLRLRFGDRFRATVESAVDVGTTVTLYIPAAGEETEVNSK